MKKQYIFTKDSSFTHVKDKMHQEATEHIIQDDDTKKLYHHVVSYGSWFKISYSSIFMSHLLREIGVTGFGLTYATDDSQIILPYYPYHKPERKSVVELPEDIVLKDVTFEHSHKKVSEKFHQTFLGKTYELKDKEGTVITKSGKDLLRDLFGCVAFQICEFIQEDECYPFFCVLAYMGYYDKKYLTKILSETDVLEGQEIKSVLQKFMQIDIAKSIEILEQEAQGRMPKLTQELIERQEIIREYLIKQQTKEESQVK